jgi:primosomal protein N' (replication factor Y)
MTIGQKFDLWRRVRDGHCRIMVGARSALFTPFDDLRIIVVDEEHEASYKQDSSPRYHARDVAIVRAQRDNCTVALGSATPSVETYFKAQSGKFHLLSLPERIDFRPLPAVRVVDMTREAKENQNVDLFSGPLQSAISDALGNGDQVLVFLNRRGFFNFVVCLDCKAAARCEHCDVAMTYHKTGEALICHYCNSRRKRPSACEACGSREVTMIGVGTQRVEEKLQAQYPEYPLIRMDLDTTRHRTAYIEAWRRIERQEVKIILGTQMVAKGLHLENVTVVGVPLADVSLFQPDFRSAERAFSLLTQVAGRAGRGAKPGQVIIQTYVPHHYAIAFAQTHDYRGFYDKEIRVRQVLRFPPHFRLISVLGLGKDSKATAELFREFARRLSNAAFRTNGAVTVLGPAPAPLARIEDHYRWRLLLRGREHRIMKDVLKEALRHYSELPGKSKVLLIVDIDPQDLL